MQYQKYLINSKYVKNVNIFNMALYIFFQLHVHFAKHYALTYCSKMKTKNWIWQKILDNFHSVWTGYVTLNFRAQTLMVYMI
jgi:hypothetical protein